MIVDLVAADERRTQISERADGEMLQTVAHAAIRPCRGIDEFDRDAGKFRIGADLFFEGQAGFAEDSRAAVRRRIEFVAGDFEKRFAQELGMFEVERNERADGRARTSHRIVAPADARFEHQPAATAQKHKGDDELCFESPDGVFVAGADKPGRRGIRDRSP